MDPALEEPFSAVVDALDEENLAAARERIGDAPNSPCETVHPDLVPVGVDHEIACLLYEDEYADARAAETVTDTGDAPADD